MMRPRRSGDGRTGGGSGELLLQQLLVKPNIFKMDSADIRIARTRGKLTVSVEPRLEIAAVER